MKDREDILLEALHHLSSHAPMSMEIYEVIHDILLKLQAGTYEEQAAAKVIHRALFWPGSPPAREAMEAFKAAIQTTQGRKAAGLPKRKRGVSKKYDPKKATPGTREFDIVVELVKGEITQKEAVDLLFETMQVYDADPRTIGEFIEGVRPHAKVYVEMPEFFKHLEENKSPDE